MTDSNSGNNTQGGTITITGSGGGGGGGGGGNGQWITAVPNKQYTITIPSGGGTCSTGGTIIFQTGTGACPQIDIDWAVPVEEKKENSDGCSCKKCKEFFEFAEPNQEDGTLICWACRHGY